MIPVGFLFHINHSLSQRVMTALEEMTPRVEQYSIDEMFLDLTGIDGCEDFEHFGGACARMCWLQPV